MKIQLTLICWFFFFLSFAPSAHSQNIQPLAEQNETPGSCKLEGKVIKVTDGDTIHVLDKDKERHKVRLAGIDAPEIGQAYGQAKRVNQKTVCVKWHKRDRYKRLVGVITYEGKDINLDVVFKNHIKSEHILVSFRLLNRAAKKQ